MAMQIRALICMMILHWAREMWGYGKELFWDETCGSPASSPSLRGLCVPRLSIQPPHHKPSLRKDLCLELPSRNNLKEGS